MTNQDEDHQTWVYHALHEAKVVKASEAKLLYKKGWRDSPDPKILYSGFLGKWYKITLWLKSAKTNISNLIYNGLFQAIFAGLIVAAITVFCFQPWQSNSQQNDQVQKQRTQSKITDD